MRIASVMDTSLKENPACCQLRFCRELLRRAEQEFDRGRDESALRLIIDAQDRLDDVMRRFS